MAERTPTLMTFYKGWETYQNMLIEMIAPLSSEHLALPASSQDYTIGMVIQHLVANRVWWFQVWMGEGKQELAPIAHWDPADAMETPTLSATELIVGLKSTWGMIAECLSRWTHTDLEQVFPPPAALREEERDLFPPFSRQWIIWHTLEHEIHHGGELSLLLGKHGLAGIYGDM